MLFQSLKNSLIIPGLVETLNDGLKETLLNVETIPKIFFKIPISNVTVQRVFGALKRVKIPSLQTFPRAPKKLDNI